MACRRKNGDPKTVSNNTTLEVIKTQADQVNTPSDALRALIEGNKRYLNGQFVHVHIKRLTDESIDKENPFVAVLACNDLRIPPEILFDVDKDNILLIKTDANIENDSTLAILQDAVKNKKIKMVLVLGHEDCPALRSIVSSTDKNDSGFRKIESSISLDEMTGKPLFNKTSLMSALNTARRIAKSITKMDSSIPAGNLIVKAAVYEEAKKQLHFE